MKLVGNALLWIARQDGTPGGSEVTSMERGVIRQSAAGDPGMPRCNPWECSRALIAADETATPDASSAPGQQWVADRFSSETWRRHGNLLNNWFGNLQNPKFEMNGLSAAALAQIIVATRQLTAHFEDTQPAPPQLEEIAQPLAELEAFAGRIDPKSAREAIIILNSFPLPDPDKAHVIEFLSPYLKPASAPDTSDEL